MSAFANGVWGIVLPPAIAKKANKALCRLLKDDVDDLDESDLILKLHKQPEIKPLIAKLGMPETARVYRVVNECDGSALSDGTLLLGWGLLEFPAITYSVEFTRFNASKAIQKLKPDWHLWVDMS